MIRSLTIQISSTSGVGPQAELEVVFSRWDQFDSPDTQRPEFQYAVRVPGFATGTGSDGTIAYGHDLRLGSGDGIDHVKAMVSLLDFLTADGEKYREQLSRTSNTSAEAVQQRTGDSYLFNEETADLAYELADELALARDELASEQDEETDADRTRRMQDDALDAIARELSGVSWNADTVERVAAIVGLTGRKIEDVSIPGGGLAGEGEDEPEPHGEQYHRPFDGFTLGDHVRVLDRFSGKPVGKGYVVALAEELVDHGGPESGPEEPVPTDVLHVRLIVTEPGYRPLKSKTVHVLPQDAENARQCSCESGARERAKYGNVHTDEEGR